MKEKSRLSKMQSRFVMAIVLAVAFVVVGGGNDVEAETSARPGKTTRQNTTTRAQAALDLFNKETLLLEQKKFDDTLNDALNDALKIYEEIDRRFKDNPAPAVREQVATALVNKGIVLGKLNDPKAEIAAYEEIDRRFKDDPTPAVREQVATALLNKGQALRKLGNSKAEIATYEEIDRRFKDDPAPNVRTMVAAAFGSSGCNQGGVIKAKAGEEGLGYMYKAFITLKCTEVIQRFKEDSTPGVREIVAKAFFNRAISKFENPKSALADIEEALLRAENSQMLTGLLFTKGKMLESSDQLKAAIATYEEIIQRFENDPNPMIFPFVSGARTSLKSLKAKTP